MKDRTGILSISGLAILPIAAGLVTQTLPAADVTTAMDGHRAAPATDPPADGGADTVGTSGALRGVALDGKGVPLTTAAV